MNVFLFQTLFYFSYFIPLIFASLLAIVVGKKVFSFVSFGSGALIQLLSLLGNKKTHLPAEMQPYWIVYFTILIVAAVCLVFRLKGKSASQKTNAEATLSLDTYQIESIDYSPTTTETENVPNDDVLTEECTIRDDGVKLGKNNIRTQFCRKKRIHIKGFVTIIVLSFVFLGTIIWDFLPFGICSRCKQLSNLSNECNYCQSDICSECYLEIQQKSQIEYDARYKAGKKEGYDNGFDDGYNAGKAAKLPEDSSFESILEERNLRKLYYNNSD